MTSLMEQYEYARGIYTTIKVALTGLVFIGLGISQLVYAWMGDSILMRFGYSTICIAIGVGIEWFCYLILSGKPLFTQSQQEQDLKERAEVLLQKLADGNYGPFRTSEQLLLELNHLVERRYIYPRDAQGSLPDSGSQLSDHFSISEEVQRFFRERGAKKE